MDELKVLVEQKPGVIKSNFNEIKDALKVQMTAYTSLEITEDNTKERKADLATLRKIRKAVDDERKRIKKEFSNPYEEFEKEVKDVLAVIDEPIDLIDSKLKEFDEARAAEKLNHVKELYSENIGEYEEYIPFGSIFNNKWLNASAKDRDIVYDISEAKTRVMSALDAVRSLKSEIEDELIEILKANDFDITKAIQRNSQYLEDKQRIHEQMANTEPEPVIVEKKPDPAIMGSLQETVEAFRTVKFIISKADQEEVENILGLSGISYRIVEG